MKKLIDKTEASFNKLMRWHKPPPIQTVTEWADNNRYLSSENSASAGRWRTNLTPYLAEIMDAFTSSKVRKIVVWASSQLGKTEMLNNILGYIIDNDPGSVIFIQPTVDTAEDYSKRRIAPMIRDCQRLRNKVADAKGRDTKNTTLKKVFPGGMLTMNGSNAPSGLASIPARYALGDEIDRWAKSAGTEGDPLGLLETRTIRFYNAKIVLTSTPTIKGDSKIEDEYYKGTREEYQVQCPECKEYSFITFSQIRYDHTEKTINRKKHYTISNPRWYCPKCGCEQSESVMKKQPAKFVAQNPDAINNKVRSFKINSFISSMISWSDICLRFHESLKDVQKLKVVYNTLFGELWEERTDIEGEDTIMTRRENYNAELPDGILVLTCGVDTQDNRLEYEVVGHGHFGETWGIKKGIIKGRPDNTEVWESLDSVISKEYKYADGKAIHISLTFIDSGGHFTQEVYEACRSRQNRRLFAIKGKGGNDVPYVKPPSKVPIRDNKNITCWLYTIGVNAGKSIIMENLKVQEAGPKYCHFPIDPECGYDEAYFNGLLSERYTINHKWEKLPGHNRNEALDCRNYALAALRILNVNMDAVERRLKGAAQPQKPKATKTTATTSRQPSARQRQLVLYAEDPDIGEIVYCYGNAGDLAEWISPNGSMNPDSPDLGYPTIVEKTIDIVTVVGSAANVTAVLASGIYITSDTLDMRLKQFKEEFELTLKQNSPIVSEHEPSAQGLGGLWLDTSGEQPLPMVGENIIIIKNAEVSETEIEDKEKMWFNT